MTYATTREAADPYCLGGGEAARLLAGHPWRRFAVLGDSVAEGLFEPTEGYLDVSWTDRIAAELTALTPGFAYLNLGQRNLLAAQVRRGQLADAIAFAPDLALVACGANDAIDPRYRPDAVDAELRLMIEALQTAGVTVMTIGVLVLDDYPGLPKAVRSAVPGRLRTWRAHVAALAAELGTIHVDLSGHPAERGPDMIAGDGVHGSGRSHAISAAASIRRLGAHLGKSDTSICRSADATG
jgi:lysophospholipase L1-like esterase